MSLSAAAFLHQLLEAPGPNPPPPLNLAHNGDFAAGTLASGRPKGWYYVKQATLTAAPQARAASTASPDAPAAQPRPQGEYLAFANKVPGRDSQAQQAFDLDASQIGRLAVSFWTRGHGVRPGQSIEQRAQLALAFFDDSKALLGEVRLNAPLGSWDWRQQRAGVPVPARTQTAIIFIGLLGGTGRADFDAIEIAPSDDNPSIFPASPEGKGNASSAR